MSLLSQSDQDRLREMFAEMTGGVRLLFFTQTLDCETCLQTRQILDELPPLSDKIAVDEVNVVLDTEAATKYGIDRAPAVVLIGRDASGVERDSRIRFVGAPAGYEFMALVQAVLLVGGRPSGLTDENRQKLAAVDEPMTLQVFTTPT